MGEQKQRKTLMMELNRTQKRWFSHMQKCAHEVGIPESYRVVIMYLSRNEGANQKKLAEFANKTTAAINRTVKEMSANGYVRIEIDEADMRYTRLYLTEKGMEKAERLKERLRRSDDIITERIGIGTEEELIALLRKICTVIEEEM